MKVLVIGSGGREHSLAWKLAGDPEVDQVLAAPGSAGIAQIAECVNVAAGDLDGLADAASRYGVDLTVVGPEAPLAAGVADVFRSRGLRVFGPGADGAALESSKAFTKKLLTEAGIPTAEYREFESAVPAKGYARELGYPVVVKADGLAAGKGVIICETPEESDLAITEMLDEGSFGEAGKRIVVEEFLRGEELSIIALTDGNTTLALASAQDHKAVFEGDTGPNTGGMGAYSPAPVATDELVAKIQSDVLEPTVAALRARGIDYRGVLYAGLMVVDGRPKVLEYNVRFGDPECQALMMRLDSSLFELLDACVDGKLDTISPRWSDHAAVCVVMASEGYPGSHRKGDVIRGLDQSRSLPSVEVFHAGTDRNREGDWITAGGRVLGVTAGGEDIQAAVNTAYDAVSKISWSGVHYRRDIAHRALGR